MTPPTLRKDDSAAHAVDDINSSFASRNRWVLFWPILLLLLGAAGWAVLLANLDRQERISTQTAMREAATLARGYADHLQHSLEAVDQIALYIKYAWERTDGLFRLDGISEAGVLPVKSGFFAAIIGRDGRVRTSTLQNVSEADLSRFDASNEPYYLTQKNSPEDRFYIGSVRWGSLSRKHVAQFSRMLVDRNGSFDGVVLVCVVPDYFIAGYDQMALRNLGLLAILGPDKSIRITRIGNIIFKPDSQALRGVPPVAGNAGVRFFPGLPWFSDGRGRFVGWQATEQYGMTVMAGLDEAHALAPYREYRDTMIRHAMLATLALVVFGVIATILSMRLAGKQRQLEGLRSTYRMATEGGTEGFYIARPVRSDDGRIEDFEVVDCNQRGAEFINLRRETLIGRRLSGLYEGEARERAFRTLCQAFDTGVFEAEQEKVSGSPVRARWMHMKIVRSGDQLAVTSRDISDTKAHLTELEKRGNEDALTGLPNRHWVKDFLPKAIARASEQQTTLAVLFIDLDGFKVVNDTMGHEAGDEVLRIAGRRLKLAVRPHDHVVRIGGDEFVVVLEDVSDKIGAAHVAERILSAFHEPFCLAQGVHSVGTSIGISLFPGDATDVDSILRHADVAMYSAKTSGKRSYRFFDQKFYESVRIRHEREAELRHAIEQDQFVVYYQPRIDLATGAMSSMEALVRWAHPTRGMIEPVEFIPLAEETGLILSLGERVIDRVCGQLAYWTRHGEKILPVSINVSARQFHEARIAEALGKALTRHHIDASLVEIEVTESSMMDGDTGVSDELEAIRKMGIRLLVDDFGTGYSSLSKLQEMDFDVLKVDKAFTAGLRRTREGQALFTAIITMAHSLGMRVVAEGVETVEQAEALRSLHCDEIQGFLVSRPLPPAENQPVFKDWTSIAAA